MRRISSDFQGRASILILVVLGVCFVYGCAGPKRLPPVVSQPDSQGSVEVGVPHLLGIGLAESRPSLVLTTGGPSILQDAQSGAVLFDLTHAELQVFLARAGNLVTWRIGSASGSVPSVRLRPVDPADHPLWDDRAYRGDLLVLPSPLGDGLTLVNNVGLEAYLLGVVPWEIGRHGQSARSALAAQAVAARTYTVSHLQERSDRGFDLYAGIMDQVYKGATDEDGLCNDAVHSTRGVVLEDRDGNLAETYYSACCGGVSSRVEKVWARPAQTYLVDHPDVMKSGAKPFCSQYRLFNWSETWSRGQLEVILQKTLPTYFADYSKGVHARWAGPVFSPRTGNSDPHSPGELLDLEILSRTPSGRIGTLAVTTAAGTYHVRGDRVRWVLAPPAGPGRILRSALFDLELVRENGKISTITARGHGYGHGIGMCQAGALVMAEQGYAYDEILAHYYPGTRLVKLPVRVQP